MKIKTSDIRKIEVFAPGTAGERAIRVETEQDVQIFDVEKYSEMEIRSSDYASFDISQNGEDQNANSFIFCVKNGEEKEYLFQAETIGQVLRNSIEFLKQENLPYPEIEDLDIEWDQWDNKSVYWNSEDDT